MTEISMVPGQINLADLPLRNDLRGISPYTVPQLNVPIRLNVNENPYPPSLALITAIQEAVGKIAGNLHRYPDQDAVVLRAKLADYINGQTGLDFSIDNIWAANGSNEIIQQILQAFGGPSRSVLGTQSSYSMHPIIAQGTHTTWYDTARSADFSIDFAAMLADIDKYQPNIIFLTRPNNPTGNSEPLAQVEKIIQYAPGIVVADEAYGEFSSDESALLLQSRYPGKLIVCRTMSKAFAFAGGRIGYLIADPAIVDAMLLVRLPYHLSDVTQAVASVAVDFAAETLASVAKIRGERERVRNELIGVGYTVLPSQANFLLYGVFHDSHAAWESYAQQGILIRDISIPGYLRVTIGCVEDNDAFLAHSAGIVSDYTIPAV